mgnify:CR=1 FL=1
MEVIKRKSVSDILSKYDHLVNKGSNKDYIEITEWNNGEGYDITLGDKMFSLSYGELAAINYLIKVLEYDK